MRIEEIREVVRITIEELLNANALTDPYPRVKEVVEHKLRAFFSGECNGIGRILNQLSDDEYIDLIFFYYRDSRTLEYIAEYYDKEVSTISRNKKRLIEAIFKLIQEK